MEIRIDTDVLRSCLKYGSREEYVDCVRDLLCSEVVLAMDEFTQHRYVTTLEHCINVSLRSYVICKRFSLDYRAAARGGLLHDLFLYDWHTDKPYRGMHAFSHPLVALENASGCFALTDRERDIIRKHMWPLTPSFPRYPETLVVSCVDKYCASMESLKFREWLYRPVHARLG